jgi:demethylmenaquinone methyltransferase/2-methoxy-6-polyprenyl-1,4-benzoquinol methylase
MSKAVHSMFSSIASSYDKTNDLLSLGIHRLWRKQSLSFAKINKDFPIRYLDICCGTGDFLLATQKRCNKSSTFFGLDFVREMLDIAQIKTKFSKSTKNSSDNKVQYLHGDALNLPFPENTMDLCTIGFGIRNVDSTPDCLLEIHRILKTGGKVVILEFGTPFLPIFKQIFQLYSKYVMPYLGYLSSGNKSAYEYLPETSAEYPCREKFCKLLKDAEFNKVSYRSFFGGIAYCYLGVK